MPLRYPRLTVAFEDLLEYVMLERNRQEIQELPEDFYTRIREEIAMLQARVAESFDDDAYRQAKNMLRLLDELYTRREAKITRAALARAKLGIDVINLSLLQPEETRLYEAILQVARETREMLLTLPHDTPLPMREEPSHTQAPDTPPPQEHVEDPARSEAEEDRVEEASPAESSVETIRIRFTKPVSPFVGDDLEIYGPYEPGDEAVLPRSVADILLEKQLAEKA